MPSIEIEDLRLSYQVPKGELEVIRDMSLSVRSGEVVSVLGPSGCGKSTLLSAVAGLLSYKSGSLKVNGMFPGTAREHGSFGVVFQEPALFPWRTALENVLLPSEIRRTRQPGTARNIDKEVEKAIDMLELVGLLGYEEALPDELSGGMRSRVAIARAIVYKPDILLMDEPFGSLDEITRNELNTELIRIKDEVACTIMFVTHSLHEAVRISDRVLVLGPRPGRVVYELDIHLEDRSAANQDSGQFTEHVGSLRQALQDGYWA